MRYLVAIALLLSSCTDDKSASARPLAERKQVASPDVAASTNGEFVQPKDILPIKVMYESMRDRRYSHVLQISETKIELQRFHEGGLATVATMPARPQDLATAIEQVSKEYFRGTVQYSNPDVLDGGKRRMITPLGEISEYGVFGWGQETDEKWPRAILSLEPLFDLFGAWSIELQKLENPQKKTAEQGGARQPTTAPDSKSEGNQKPKPESEGRSQ